MTAWRKTGMLLGIVGFMIVFFKVILFPDEIIIGQVENVHSINSSMISVPIEAIISGDPIELAQDDPRITKFIWDHGYLQPPSERNYNLTDPDKNPSMGQGQMIRKIFKDMTGGFFCECGALDGETRSNSLYLEKELGWKGLLIEADPKNYDIILEKRRKAWTSNSCLATKPYPHKVVFQQNFSVGKIGNESWKLSPTKNETISEYVVMQCFPLYSLLSALSISSIDYFSLDVEGVEMEVLANIPFDKIFIKTLSVEFNHIGAGKDALKKFMENKGYVVVAEVINRRSLANDFIFVHHSLHELIDFAKNG